MIVADTSALVSLATIELLDTFLTEFDVHTSEIVIEELADTGEYDDRHGAAAATVLDNRDRLTVHPVDEPFTSSRVDTGEGSCAVLATQVDAAFLITDDLRALPELQTVADAEVAISPIVFQALVQRDVLARAAALTKLDRLAAQRDWLGAPIYRRATALFED
jgi:predicted nucleic acid-binding protein